MINALDVIVIGGGQAGLAVSYYLRRAGVRFVVLDNATSPGGAWLHTWDSLRLFSPAQFSSLPGWQMPNAKFGDYPTRVEVVDYLTRYEQRYELPIKRPVDVKEVTFVRPFRRRCGHWNMGRAAGDQRHRHLERAIPP